MFCNGCGNRISETERRASTRFNVQSIIMNGNIVYKYSLKCLLGDIDQFLSIIFLPQDRKLLVCLGFCFVFVNLDQNF